MSGYTNPLSDSNAIKTEYGYDSFGNVTSLIDPNGVATSYTIDQCGHSYPSAITRAGFTLSEIWDCGTGLLASATDPNSVTTKRTLDNVGGRRKLMKVWPRTHWWNATRSSTTPRQTLPTCRQCLS